MPQGPIHFGEGTVIPDPFIVKNCGERAVKELDSLLGMFAERGFVFATAGELADQFSNAT